MSGSGKGTLGKAACFNGTYAILFGAKVGVNGVNDGAKEKDVRAAIVDCIKQDERMAMIGISET